VFRVDPHGDLHMRYTARTRSIAWRQDAATAAAVALLAATLADARHVVRVRLTAGMGVIANNVLHARAGFRDGAARRRLLYRARFYERIDGTQAAYGQIAGGYAGGADSGSRL
jgi:alpha-ketoglutarate-dependent taurine dioxygenase